MDDPLQWRVLVFGDSPAHLAVKHETVDCSIAEQYASQERRNQLSFRIRQDSPHAEPSLRAAATGTDNYTANETLSEK